eukprot:1996234-Lingulodinium_polyedra.AAC.1
MWSWHAGCSGIRCSRRSTLMSRIFAVVIRDPEALSKTADQAQLEDKKRSQRRAMAAIAAIADPAAAARARARLRRAAARINGIWAP